jgi:hypothetical protein
MRRDTAVTKDLWNLLELRGVGGWQAFATGRFKQSLIAGDKNEAADAQAQTERLRQDQRIGAGQGMLSDQIDRQQGMTIGKTDLSAPLLIVGHKPDQREIRLGPRETAFPVKGGGHFGERKPGHIYAMAGSIEKSAGDVRTRLLREDFDEGARIEEIGDQRASRISRIKGESGPTFASMARISSSEISAALRPTIRSSVSMYRRKLRFLRGMGSLVSPRSGMRCLWGLMSVILADMSQTRRLT